MRYRLAATTLALALAGCTFNVNQPNLTANTAVGDGANVVAGSPGPGPSAAPAAPASASPSGARGAAKGPKDPAGLPAHDQQAERTSLSVEVSKDARVAQSFTPSRSGRLAAIGLLLSVLGQRPPRVTLQLFATGQNGAPAGQVLAEAAIVVDDISGNLDDRWIAARFATPVPLEGGKRYAWAIVVDSVYPINVGAGDPRGYEAGEGWSSSGAGEVWNKQGVDFAFRSYMLD